MSSVSGEPVSRKPASKKRIPSTHRHSPIDRHPEGFSPKDPSESSDQNRRQIGTSALTDSSLTGSLLTGVSLPASSLYIVATPIGNLEDITLRALRILREVDVIACEDTRQTQKLLNHFDIPAKTVSYHQHNEAGRAEQLIERLRSGERIALVSDAGTPGINDPGSVLISAAIAAGIPVVPVPGANAAIAALVAGGLDTSTFVYLGFLPARQGERRSFLENLRGEKRTMVGYESPHRIADALADIAATLGAERKIVLARELTKLHEEFLRGTATEILSHVSARGNMRGEMVLLIAGAEESAQAPSTQTLPQRVDQLMREEQLDEKSALKRAARERNLSKSEAYREWQRRKPGIRD